MFHRDYLMRIIEQVIEAVARMLGLIEKGKPELALQEAGRVYELLGIPRELVEVAPSETLVQLAGEPTKMRLLAKVLAAEGDAYAASKDPLMAVSRRRLAMELYIESNAREPNDEAKRAIRELARVVPSSSLDERFQSKGP